METDEVDKQFFIPREKFFYTNPDVTHSDETKQKLTKEERQT
jgi:DNA (cytosine-5)-methyltransferase 1